MAVQRKTAAGVAKMSKKASTPKSVSRKKVKPSKDSVVGRAGSESSRKSLDLHVHFDHYDNQDLCSDGPPSPPTRQDLSAADPDIENDDAAANQLLRETAASVSPAVTPAKKGRGRPKKSIAQVSSEEQPSKVGDADGESEYTDLQILNSMGKFSEEQEAQQDEEFMERLKELHSLIVDFCDDMLNFKIRGKPGQSIQRLLDSASPELIRYVGCIAVGGPKGREGWEELLLDQNLRKALVYGIVNKVVKEHVLGSLFFGAPEQIMKEVERMEEENLDKDGFYRAAERGRFLKDALEKRGPNRRAIGIIDEISRVAVQAIVELLRPILELRGSATRVFIVKSREQTLLRHIKSIVTHAAHMNGYMRYYFGGDRIYFFQPIFKDEEFDPSRMDCYNLRDMQESCPLDIEDENGKRMARPQGDVGDPTDVALVRIVCSFGCVVYRKGGGHLGKRLLEEEAANEANVPPDVRAKQKHFRGREFTVDDGFRTKVLSKGLVALRWGKPRKFGQEAKEEDENYLELYDIFADTPTPKSHCAIM